jgi:hypothetical protein
MNAGQRASGGGARRIVLGLVNPYHDGTALRIGEGNDLTKQVVSSVCGEITPGQPGIGSITLGRKIPFKFEKLVFINSFSA